MEQRKLNGQAFLQSALTEGTRRKYSAALEMLNAWCLEDEAVFLEMTNEVRNGCLADRFLEESFFRQWRERAFRASYPSLLVWRRKVSKDTGSEALDVTTHLSRRPGASELSRQGVGWTKIMEHGRWNVDRAAREYIQEEEKYFSGIDLSEEVWQQATRWAQQASHAWTIFGAAMTPDGDGDEKERERRRRRRTGRRARRRMD